MAGIYIHIPFCKQACHYCDFHFSTSLKKKEELITCLVHELQLRKEELDEEPIETIYFGGGTPSLLSNAEIEKIITAIYQHYEVIATPEITLEANPDDLSKERIVTLSQSAINRLSIGIQSFFEEDLQLMNRAHNAKEAMQCLELATEYFDNITIDLIYGIPKMSNARWQENLQKAFDLGIHHISSYALTVEPKTALDTFIRKGKYPDVDETVAKAHFDILLAETEKNGFVHYEISNFGKPDYFSKHNTSYWLGKKYIGIGPSAHSFNGISRSWNIANNSKYIKGIQTEELPCEIENLSTEDRFNEYIMTGLRTIWGVSLTQITQNFGSAYERQLLREADKFLSKGLLERYIEATGEEKLRTTQKGKFLVDGIAAELFII